METIAHALTSCCFLAAAFHIALQCMGPAILGDTQETDPTKLLVEQPALSLQAPLGLVYWTLVRASWSLRKSVKFKLPPPLPGSYSSPCGSRAADNLATEGNRTSPAPAGATSGQQVPAPSSTRRGAKKTEKGTLCCTEGKVT